MSDVTVRIDELVLVGFSQDERDLAVSALQDELAGLLDGVSPRGSGLPRATLDYRLGRERGPEAVGRAAARSIARAVGVRR